MLPKRLPHLSLALLILTASTPSGAIVDFCDVVAFPSCLRDFGNCEFDLDYGNTGTVRALGALHIAGQGTLINPQIQGQTDLSLECEVTGEGTAQMTITTSILNANPMPTSALTFFAFLNPDGNATSPSPHLNDSPSADFSAVTEIGEPDAWGFDDLANLDAMTAGNLDHEVFALGALSDTDYCAPTCDVVTAIQWDLGVLGPNEGAIVTVSYSDDGTLYSQRSAAISRADGTGVPDDPGTVLTLSGYSLITGLVPAMGLPARLALALSVVVLGSWVGGAARRTRTARSN